MDPNVSSSIQALKLKFPKGGTFKAGSNHFMKKYLF